MENKEYSQPNCKYCNDTGYIYTCHNCFKPAIYDSEFGVIVCDDCFVLGDKQNTISEKCTNCNIADVVFDIPKVGDKFLKPTIEQLQKIINWKKYIKIPLDNSYDLINPILIEYNILKFYSYVQNILKEIEISSLTEIEVLDSTISSVRWQSDLKGVVNYLNEDQNRNIIRNKKYIRLVSFDGCSWDLYKVTYDNIIARNNLKESHFPNGLTLSIKTLLEKSNHELSSKIENFNDLFYHDKNINVLYKIGTIKKFEFF